MYDKKHYWWQCQKCGQNIGLLGRLFARFTWFHVCKRKKSKERDAVFKVLGGGTDTDLSACDIDFSKEEGKKKFEKICICERTGYSKYCKIHGHIE